MWFDWIELALLGGCPQIPLHMRNVLVKLCVLLPLQCFSSSPWLFCNSLCHKHCGNSRLCVLTLSTSLPAHCWAPSHQAYAAKPPTCHTAVSTPSLDSPLFFMTFMINKLSNCPTSLFPPYASFWAWVTTVHLYLFVSLILRKPLVVVHLGKLTF